MSDAFEAAWSVLKALPEQQVRDPYGHAVKTIHPAIAGMMQRRGTFRPEGQRMHNPKGVAPTAANSVRRGLLQGGHRTSMRPQSDLTMEDYFPHELDEGYATPEEHAAAMEDLYFYREPRFKPTVPGYASREDFMPGVVVNHGSSFNTRPKEP